MADVDDLPLDHTPAPTPAPRPAGPSRVPIVLVLGLFAAVLVVAGVLLSRRPQAPAATTNEQRGAAAPAETPARVPLAGDVAPIDLPPLDASDPLVRDLLGALSSRPEVAAWLTTDGLIRNFVVSLANVANGATPARQLRPLAPQAPFPVVHRGGRIFVDPRGYDRYSGIAESVASLQPADLARLYGTLKPRLRDAYCELGFADCDIDAALERALVRLLDTPVPTRDLELTPGIAAWRFADERYEQLAPAQKQFLRMGPANMRVVQRQLWSLGRELGIPTSRLPSPPTE